MSLFHIFNALAINYFVYSLQISIIAFFIIFVRYITVREGISNLVIYKYTPDTSRIGIRLFGLAVLLKALNTIYRTASLLILDSLIIII